MGEHQVSNQSRASAEDIIGAVPRLPSGEPVAVFTEEEAAQAEKALENRVKEPPKLPFPRRQKIVLLIGFSLTAYVNGLENFVMNVFTNTAAAQFNSAVQFSTLQVIQAMIVSTSKPPFAKVADIFGRSTVYIVSLMAYVIGNIITACSHNIKELAAGIVFSAIGNAGIALAQQLLVADLVPPRYRGLAYYLIDLPFFINYGVSPLISGALIPEHWRWGPGMCGILLPVATVPTITILLLQEREARRLGLLGEWQWKAKGILGVTKKIVIDFDLLGMFCFCGGFLLLLVPLTIADRAPHGYRTGYILAMLVLGGSLLIVWPFVERHVSRPLIRFDRIVKNRDILIPASIWFLDQISLNFVATPLFQWIQVVFGWSVADSSYFNGSRTLCLVFFGIIGGILTSYTKRYKWVTVIGGAIRLLGISLMYKYRQGGVSRVQVVMPQIIQGLGDGFMTVNILAVAQASVDHGQAAIVTGVMLLVFQVGVAVGSAASGAVQHGLLTELHHSLDPIANSTVITEIYGGASLALRPYPIGSPIREGVIVAWTTVMRREIVGSIIVAAMCFALTWFLSNKQLSATSQNNMVQEDLTVVVVAREKKLQQASLGVA